MASVEEDEDIIRAVGRGGRGWSLPRSRPRLRPRQAAHIRSKASPTRILLCRSITLHSKDSSFPAAPIPDLARLKNMDWGFIRSLDRFIRRNRQESWDPTRSPTTEDPAHHGCMRFKYLSSPATSDPLLVTLPQDPT
ncbi:hypothetical protein HAX54_004813 [Datura stramonium]|uniref:Uncharacterized protein n=1 Tax=Datura stramonium TaxID=4076 RepID=A0ABS8T8X6_DATST|nr:hypothetical protein [Datura stramonium]